MSGIPRFDPLPPHLTREFRAALEDLMTAVQDEAAVAIEAEAIYEGGANEQDEWSTSGGFYDDAEAPAARRYGVRTLRHRDRPTRAFVGLRLAPDRPRRLTSTNLRTTRTLDGWMVGAEFDCRAHGNGGDRLASIVPSLDGRGPSAS